MVTLGLMSLKVVRIVIATCTHKSTLLTHLHTQNFMNVIIAEQHHLYGIVQFDVTHNSTLYV